MPALSRREHALLFKTLVKECGGFDEAAKACRLNRTRLYEIANPQSFDYAPIDVVADLEAYCGRPVYSQALVAARPATDESASGGAVTVACDVSEAANDLQKIIRQFASDGELSANERVKGTKAALHLYELVQQLCAALNRGQA